MHVATDRPEEIGAAPEGAIFLRIEHAAFQQLFGIAYPVDVFRDPEQRVQIAQSALAVLDVRLDQIAGLAGAAMAFLTFRKFRGDEFGGSALHHFRIETRYQFIIKGLIAGEKARLQNGGADGHVAARLPDRFIDRAGGMSDLQPHVPQTIEDRFGNLFAPGGLFVRKNEQQIDVGLRCHQAAAIAAGGHHRHALGPSRDRRMIEVLGRGGEQHADDFILHDAQPLGATAAVAILEQHRLCRLARLDEFDLQHLRQGRTESVLAAGIRRP